jgi:hypothetical protein
MPPETRSAAEAFDALRAEVSETHAEMRKLAKTVTDKPTPDYDLTLGQMAKRLAAMDDRLVNLAHLMPRATLPAEIYLPHELVAITEQAKAAAQELRAATGAAIEHQAVRRWMAGTAGMGVFLGILLCLGLVSFLPRETGAWMAAAIVGGDPWTAGQTLMREGDPATFERMVRLYQACPQDSTTQLCVAAIAVKAAGSR